MRRLLDLSDFEKVIIEGKIKGNWDVREIDEKGAKGYIIRGHFESDQPMEPIVPFEPLNRRRRPPVPERLVSDNAVNDVSEPLVDVFVGETEVKVYVELPIGENDEPQLNVTEGGVEIKAKGFHKLVDIPVDVDIEKASSRRKNRVLVITIPRKMISTEERGQEITIE